MQTFQQTTAYFTGSNGFNIFYRSFSAAKEKARLVIAHGLGEHSGRYERVVQRLVAQGISVWALDFCGHGQSDGRRGHIESFDQYIADLDKLIDKAAEGASQQMRIFLLGHSLGGLIALNYALRFPDKLNGLVVSSPVLASKVKIPPFKKMLGQVMSAIWPGLSMSNELDPTKISHDPSVVDAYIQDPLVHNRVTARWFTEFLSAMARVNQSAGNMKTPILMQIAGDDFLVDAAASQTFYHQLRLKDKTIHVYGDLFHEIFNEPADQSAAVLDDLCAWLLAH